VDHDAGYRPWDWAAKAPGDRRELDAGAAILVECCGALTPASAAMATTRIWCEADPRTRRRRALDRDGEMFAPYWQMWAVQEELHWLRHRPRTLADIVVG
ncbi:MAG: cobalt ABC transporter, partial [Acidipropionibacterium jensenii]|nr:cobalt ABC transporter [Acidipropionibacterium jensenii]